MKKVLILLTSTFLCLVLSGCSGQAGSADGDRLRSLQDMAMDDIEREVKQDENAGEADESKIPTASENKVGEAGTTAGMTEGNDADKTQPDVSKTTYIHDRDLDEIKEYLAQFPSTLQELSETECYVIRHGIEYSGREYLNAFIENVKAENPGELVFVQLTTEGAPILTYLNYDGKNVYCVEDISRDGFAGGNGEKYFEKYYDSIWLTANTDAEGNFNMSLWALWEEDMVLDLFTAHTEESVMCELPPWAKPPAP